MNKEQYMRKSCWLLIIKRRHFFSWMAMEELRKHTCDEIFGGKVVVFRGDFRQILSRIPRGGLSDIVHSTINASYFWDYYEVLSLTKKYMITMRF